jgi:hypothetical protein
MSAAAQSRSYRREQKIRQYLEKQPGQSSGAPSGETAVHIVQDLGLYVSDKRAHEWWCSLFDMIQGGVVIEEPDGSSVRLATEEELKKKLAGESEKDWQASPEKITLSLIMIGRKDNV